MRKPFSICRKAVCFAVCFVACLSTSQVIAPFVAADDAAADEFPASQAAASQATAGEVDSVTTSQRAVRFLVDEGVKWIEKRGCVSCHQVPAMLWSLHTLQEAGGQNSSGLADGDLNRWTDWSVDPVNFVKPEQKTEVDVPATLAANIDTMAAMLLAVPNVRSMQKAGLDAPDADWRDMFTQALCREQQADGSWKACGQLPMQKRPKRETSAATTLWVALALSRSGCTDFDFTAAVDFADSGEPAVSTEWYAVRAMVASQKDVAQDADDSHLSRLLEHQNADGGWGWIVDQDSDALATGIALYAVAQTHPLSAPGERANDELAKSVSKARDYLKSTQLQSGAWKVPGTKRSAKGRPTATANYWGTAWAVVGLESTRSMLSEQKSPD